jgi:hypothetical protein
MTSERKYSLTPQLNKDYCMCSVLQAILNRYEINIPQEQISNQLTVSKYGHLVDDGKITDFLDSFGFNYTLHWNNETPFNEPDFILNEMNKHDGFVGINTHVYLLESFRDPYIRLNDPEDNNIITKDLPTVIEEMGNQGFFALIKKQE